MAGNQVTIGGVMCELREVVTRKGSTMCFFQLEDQLGEAAGHLDPGARVERVEDERALLRRRHEVGGLVAGAETN